MHQFTMDDSVKAWSLHAVKGDVKKWKKSSSNDRDVIVASRRITVTLGQLSLKTEL